MKCFQNLSDVMALHFQTQARHKNRFCLAQHLFGDFMASSALLSSCCSLSAKILQALTLLDLPHGAKCNILAGCWQWIS